MPRRKSDWDRWFELGEGRSTRKRRRRRSTSDWAFDAAPSRRRRRNSSSGSLPCIGPLLLIGLVAYVALGAISGLLAAVSQRPELALFLALAAVLFLVTGLPALIFLGLGIRRKNDHARRVKLWQWQQVMKSFGADYGSDYSGPPHDWIAALSWAELEQLATDVFNRLGYRARSVGRSGDRGIDVYMVSPAGGIEVVQCKQRSSPVGEPDVRNLYGAMMHAGAQRAFLFAPQGFTASARDFAQGKPIVLCDLPTICRLVEYGQEGVAGLQAVPELGTAAML